MTRLTKLSVLATFALFVCGLGPAQAQLNANTNLVLLANATATGPQQMWTGGLGFFSVVGTWAGATVTLQYVGPDGVTLLPAGSGTTLTANGGGTFNLPRGLIQATITGATGTTSLTANAKPLVTFIQ